MKIDFISDNTSGVHPRVLEAIASANEGHCNPYGEGDKYTLEMNKVFDNLFGQKVYAHTVFNGTGGNISALGHITRRHNAIICADCSHINEDECAAPEHMLGSKLLALRSKDGKFSAESMLEYLSNIGSQHSAQPGVVSITQLTEKGTAYSVDEIKNISSLARKHGLYVHMDGSRISNCVAHLGVDIRDITLDCGVDVVSFGGTKNGMLFGEAVIFFDENLAKGFEYTRKNNAQLYSKNRFIAAQFIEMLQDGLWLETASHANDMAKKLESELRKIAGVEILYPVNGNEIFCSIGEAGHAAALSDGLIHEGNPEYTRLVTAFDTSEEHIYTLISALRP